MVFTVILASPFGFVGFIQVLADGANYMKSIFRKTMYFINLQILKFC